MSNTTQEYVNEFWGLLDVILNALFFILIAFVIIVIDFKTDYILLELVSIFIVTINNNYRLCSNNDT